MGQYEDRIAIVEKALEAAKVKPAKGKSLADAAVKVLAAIDEIKEKIR